MARMEDTRLPMFVMSGELMGGACCVGEQEKEWMGYFLDDLRAFGINADQWTTAAQDEGEWRKTAEQGEGRFMEGFNDWGGRGYDDFVPGVATKTAPSGGRTT